MFDQSFFSADVASSLKTALHIVYVTSPAWLLAVTSIALFNAFLSYKRTAFWAKQKTVLLEIKLPRDLYKSPAAMEIILAAFQQNGGEATWIDRIWKGQTRPWFSFEIVSTGGKIHFYIWMWERFRGAIEANIYAQYPGIEIHEVEDYSIPIVYNKEKNEVWGCQWELTKPDPYPIKTYVDYGLDRDPKEEFKIDPLVSTLEFLGSVPEGHNLWIQILIRSHRKRRFADIFSEKEDAWADQSKAEVKKIVENFRPTDATKQSRQATEGEKDTISAIERSVTKYPFDCSIRTMYTANKDIYNPGFIGGLMGSWRQYGSLNLNGFKPSGWFITFSYPWQEWGGKKEWMKSRLLLEYKLRRFFYSPFMGKSFYSKPFVLNTEELATLYHFPGAVAGVPTFERIPSRKAEAPSNLPT